MKKLYEMKNTVVNVKTEEEYWEYMRMCNNAGWSWFGISEISQNWFGQYKHNTCIDISDRFYYSHINHYQNWNYKIITLKQLKEKLMDKWKQGDIIVNRFGNGRKILGVCGNVVFQSTTHDFSIANDGIYTQKELKNKGWKLKKEKEKMTMGEVCDELGREIEITKDKNETEEE